MYNSREEAIDAFLDHFTGKLDFTSSEVNDFFKVKSMDDIPVVNQRVNNFLRSLKKDNLLIDRRIKVGNITRLLWTVTEKVADIEPVKRVSEVDVVAMAIEHHNRLGELLERKKASASLAARAVEQLISIQKQIDDARKSEQDAVSEIEQLMLGGVRAVKPKAEKREKPLLEDWINKIGGRLIHAKVDEAPYVFGNTRKAFRAKAAEMDPILGTKEKDSFNNWDKYEESTGIKALVQLEKEYMDAYQDYSFTKYCLAHAQVV